MVVIKLTELSAILQSREESLFKGTLQLNGRCQMAFKGARNIPVGVPSNERGRIKDIFNFVCIASAIL